MNKQLLEINLIKIPSLVIKFGGDRKIEVASGKQSKGIIQTQVKKSFKKVKNK